LLSIQKPSVHECDSIQSKGRNVIATSRVLPIWCDWLSACES